MGSSRRMIRQSRAIKAEPQVLIEVAGPASRDHGRPSIMAESPWNLQAPAQPHVGQWPSIQCEMPVNAVGTPETDVSVLSGLSSTRESRKSLASTGFTTPDVLLDTEMSNLQSSQAGSRFNRKRESLSQLELDKKLAHQLQQEEDSIENLANQGHMMYTSDALLDYQAQLCRLEEKNRHRLGLKRAADSPDRPSKRKKPDVKSESLSKDQLGVETVDLIEDGDVRSCECSPGTSDDDIPLQGKRRRGKQVARKSTASRKTIASRKTVASRVKVEPTIKPEPGTCLSSEGLKISTLATPAESLIPSLGYGGNGEMYGDSEDSSRDLLSDEFSSVDGDGCVLGTHESLQEQNFRKNHPGLVNAWTTLETIPLTPKKKAEQPRGIVTRTLKDFQLEGLNWMLEQEKGPFRGGLLGDEMGMGKTIQAVSLLVSDHDPKLRRKPSLVVVPPVALMQWKNEISLYTDNALKIFVWHGMGGKMSNIKRAELLKHDIILITYSGLESVYRKQTKGWKRGDSIVKADSLIHDMEFRRVVLDEAHNIKGQSTGAAKACYALKADHRWCLSGTPLQNRIGELISLLKFLEITPFTHYFCRTCPCETTTWHMIGNRECSSCGHTPMQHGSFMNKELLHPIQEFGNTGNGKAGFRKLKLLTDRIMLRRVKRDHVTAMELPPKDVIVRREMFNEVEKDLASSLMSNTTRQFENYVARGVMLNNYANIFGLLMQMRQIADHPDLFLRRHDPAGQNALVCTICDDIAEEAIRSQCKHVYCRRCVKNFIRQFDSQGLEADCARCHVPLAIDLEQPEVEQEQALVKRSSIINRINMENWTSSTKIEMLMYELYRLRSRKQTNKSIVFSQFTSMLQLIEWRLHRAGFKTVMLDGTMTPAQRAASIEHFMTNVGVEVFLVSLKAGGVALNLTEASRVFIVDPWWNPAAEWQSADRCHRIGQQRPCVITRLCVEDSVESRMVLLQEKKANMIHGTINGDSKAMEQLTTEDMQFLFRAG